MTKDNKNRREAEEACLRRKEKRIIMRKKIIAGNWKMNKTPKEALDEAQATVEE